MLPKYCDEILLASPISRYACSETDRSTVVKEIMAALPEDAREGVIDAAARLRNNINALAHARGKRAYVGELSAIELVLTLACKYDLLQ